MNKFLRSVLPIALIIYPAALLSADYKNIPPGWKKSSFGVGEVYAIGLDKHAQRIFISSWVDKQNKTSKQWFNTVKQETTWPARSFRFKQDIAMPAKDGSAIHAHGGVRTLKLVKLGSDTQMSMLMVCTDSQYFRVIELIGTPADFKKKPIPGFPLLQEACYSPEHRKKPKQKNNLTSLPQRQETLNELLVAEPKPPYYLLQPKGWSSIQRGNRQFIIHDKRLDVAIVGPWFDMAGKSLQQWGVILDSLASIPEQQITQTVSAKTNDDVLEIIRKYIDTGDKLEYYSVLTLCEKDGHFRFIDTLLHLEKFPHNKDRTQDLVYLACNSTVRGVVATTEIDKGEFPLKADFPDLTIEDSIEVWSLGRYSHDIGWNGMAAVTMNEQGALVLDKKWIINNPEAYFQLGLSEYKKRIKKGLSKFTTEGLVYHRKASPVESVLDGCWGNSKLVSSDVAGVSAHGFSSNDICFHPDGTFETSDFRIASGSSSMASMGSSTSNSNTGRYKTNGNLIHLILPGGLIVTTNIGTTWNGKSRLLVLGARALKPQ